MLPEALDRACSAARPQMIYCTPNIQNPTTATMSMERRQAVIAVARRHGVMILEDDAYGLLPQTRLPALAALAPEQCVLCRHRREDDFSWATDRLPVGAHPGACDAPDCRPCARPSLTTAGLLTGLTAAWIRGGQAAALLDAIRREAVARQEVAREVLGEAISAHPQGLHAWLRLPAHWGSTDFTAYLRNKGLALVPSDVFAVAGHPPPRVRIALGAATGREALRNSLLSVAAALLHNPMQGFADVV